MEFKECYNSKFEDKKELDDMMYRIEDIFSVIFDILSSEKSRLEQ